MCWLALHWHLHFLPLTLFSDVIQRNTTVWTLINTIIQAVIMFTMLWPSKYLPENFYIPKMGFFNAGTVHKNTRRANLMYV